MIEFHLGLISAAGVVALFLCTVAIITHYAEKRKAKRLIAEDKSMYLDRKIIFDGSLKYEKFYDGSISVRFCKINDVCENERHGADRCRFCSFVHRPENEPDFWAIFCAKYGLINSENPVIPEDQ